MSFGVIPANLNQLPPKHGGDLAFWQRTVGDQAFGWLDLSSACNREPWPVPTVDVSLWSELPDQAILFEKAARFYGVRPSVIGAGTQHIIESLPGLLSHSHSVKRALLPRIGYQEHAFAWQKWGYDIGYYDDVAVLLEEQWSVAVIIHPNNPTATLASRLQLQQVINNAEQQGSHLIIDEAFMDAIPQESVLSLLNGLPRHSDSLFVLRSVGKFFGLAGARVGFAFCSSHWQCALNNMLGPWPVSTASLFLVGQAFDDVSWQTRAMASLKARNKAFRARVVPKLNTIFDSQDYAMNPLFYTWTLESQEYAEQVFGLLHEVGVHTRLGDGWIRVAMPALDEMDRLNNALIRLLKKAGGRDLA